MSDPTPKHQALVMLVELDDGTFAMMDAGGNKHEAGTAEALWEKAKALVSAGDVPALESAPGQGPTVEAKRDEQKLEEAFGTIGDKLKVMAEAEYGAPLVDAASTVLGHASKKTSGFLRKLSRKKSKPRRYLKRRRTG